MREKNLVKLVCVVGFVVGLVVISTTDPLVINSVHAFSDGPPAGHTGAPGELTCVQCHTGQPNSGPGTLEVIAPSTYEPGQTYQIMIKHMTTDNSRRRWGFQVTALDSNNSKIGDLQSTASITGVINNDGPGGSRQYIEHVAGGTFQGQTGGAIWSFSWTAPSEDLGPVVFYASGNQANNDGNSTGDQIYTTRTFVLTGPPMISGAEVVGKQLIVTGKNFGPGASLFVNGERQKKTLNDETRVTTMIIARKAGKFIGRGSTVTIEVRNPDGTMSAPFSFTRPV